MNVPTYLLLTMKQLRVCAAALVAALSLCASASYAQIVPFDADRWEMNANEARVEDYLGRQSLTLRGGTAWIKDSDFTDGVIEFDIAFSGERGFMGGIWRMQDRRNYEEFYMRPHQSGKPDANQYTPVINGVSGWQLYHGAGYGAPVAYSFDQWMHVKIVVSGGQGEVYIDSEEPVLVMHALKRAIEPGKVGVSAGNFATAHFSNFSYQAMDRPALNGQPPEPSPAPAGTVMTWSVSSAFDEAGLADKAELTAADQQGLTWTTLAAEASGITNLARVQGLGQGENTAFARITIQSERAQVKTVRFGYSDRVKVYLNGRLLYGGSNQYQSRDFRYLGTIGLFDALYLPLKQGANELWFAVSESFGGWGILGVMADRQGLTLEP